VESLVRADLVELVAEVVESTLLGWETAGRRDGGFLLERAVHPLVDRVLLGPTGFDELRVDVELDEPDGESGEPGQGAGGEWDAIVGADAIGEAIGLKEPPEVL
jgi:hypothetical protein